MSETIEVRPFKGRDEYQRMVDYFVGATDAFLAGMGVDRARLPAREAWLEAVMRDHGRPPREKERGPTTRKRPNVTSTPKRCDMN